MRMNAVLSNPKHPEYGQFTVPLPIPHNQYNGIMEALNAMDMGNPLARDCQMDEILGEYPILKRLEGKPVNIDELDYLAKRLDSFCYMYLKDRADSEGRCWPAIKTIALELGLSRSTVKRALDDLVRAGLLRKDPRWRENGSYTSNLYQIT